VAFVARERMEAEIARDPRRSWGARALGSAAPVAGGYRSRDQAARVGEWGPVVNGGGWLTVAGLPVDVLFRDLDTIKVWLREAEQGRFEVCVQSGYVVGAPTYLPVGELALCKPITGELPRPTFPSALAAAARSGWQGRASVSLLFAHGRARLADVVCCTGMLTDAILCTAHARLAWRREWVLNEKRLVEHVGLGVLQSALARPGGTIEELLATVAIVTGALDGDPLTIR